MLFQKRLSPTKFTSGYKILRETGWTRVLFRVRKQDPVELGRHRYCSREEHTLMGLVFLLTFYSQLALTLTSCSLVSPPSDPATWLPFTSMGCGASSEQHKDIKVIRAYCFENGM